MATAGQYNKTMRCTQVRTGSWPQFQRQGGGLGKGKTTGAGCAESVSSKKDMAYNTHRPRTTGTHGAKTSNNPLRAGGW